MSELNIPESWAETTLGVIGTTMIGLTYSPKDISDKGIPVLRSGNIQFGKIDLNDLVRVKKDIKSQLMIQDGDILICARNGSRRLVGKAAMIKNLNEPMTFGAFMAIYRSQFNQYVNIFLNSLFFRNQLEGVGTATINQITQNNLKQFLLPLPPELEQKRIVQKIESCFSKIEETEKNLNKVEILLEKYRESLLAKAFRGELIPQNPDDEPASVLLEKIREGCAQNQKGKKKEQEFATISDEEKPFDIPESWEWTQIDRIFELENGDRGKNYPSGKDIKTEGIPFVNAGHLSDGILEDVGLNYISEVKYNQLGSGKFTENDILFCLRGTLGKFGIVRGIKRGAIASSLVILRPKGKLNNEFLKYYFQTPLVRQMIKNYDNGSAQPNLSSASLKIFLIPLPPLDEQNRIAKKLDLLFLGITQLSSKIIKKEASLNCAREAILKKAFEGRLVEQISSEGTGQDLLQKILEYKKQEISSKESTKKQVTKKVSKRITKK